jgi:hypothetical protein
MEIRQRRSFSLFNLLLLVRMIVLFSEDESFEEIDDLGLWWREGVEGEGRKDCWSAIKGSQVFLSLLLSKLSPVQAVEAEEILFPLLDSVLFRKVLAFFLFFR